MRGKADEKPEGGVANGVDAEQGDAVLAVVSDCAVE
jgi:hypothetical protein